MRYNNACLKLSHLSIFSTENEYKNQKTEYEVYQFLDIYWFKSVQIVQLLNINYNCKHFIPYKLIKY